MNYTTMIFSPTGGTEKAVMALTSGWGERIATVDLSNAGLDFSQFSFQPKGTVVIAAPSYGGRVPGLAAERIQKVQGNGAKAVLVCVYGNRAYEDTLVELEDLAKAAGFTVTAAVAAIAEHSIARRFAAGRPDAEDLAILAGYGQTILERLQSSAQVGPIPGNHPYKKAGGSGYMFRMATVQDFSAVTAACLLVRSEVYDEVGGLDEGFAVAFNDVDFCLRVRDAGYRIIWTPYARLYHYESKSRGNDEKDKTKKVRFAAEQDRLTDRFTRYGLTHDPYYNPSLTLDREDFSESADLRNLKDPQTAL